MATPESPEAGFKKVFSAVVTLKPTDDHFIIEDTCFLTDLSSETLTFASITKTFWSCG